MTKFETGKTYEGTSRGGANCPLQLIRRTACFGWFKYWDGIRKAKISYWDFSDCEIARIESWGIHANSEWTEKSQQRHNDWLD